MSKDSTDPRRFVMIATRQLRPLSPSRYKNTSRCGTGSTLPPLLHRWLHSSLLATHSSPSTSALSVFKTRCFLHPTDGDVVYSVQHLAGYWEPPKCPHVGCDYADMREEKLFQHLHEHCGQTPHQRYGRNCMIGNSRHSCRA